MQISRRKFFYIVPASVASGIALYFGVEYISNAISPKAEEPKNLVVEVFLEGLQVPWSMAFARDGRFFFTERMGRIRMVEDGRLSEKPFAQPPAVAVGEGGLLGLALDPEFENNHYLYAYYTYEDGRGRLLNRVVRYRDSDGKGEDPLFLIDRIPGGGIHDGGRIKFGPDGKLYVTTGETGSPNLSQDLSSLGGKILRINPDGSIPSQNPFKDSPVFSYGHRNPQGLSWHPVTGKLYSSEHGPSGESFQFAHDEINIIEAGRNYGWPNIVGKGGDSRFANPVMNTEKETWAPSGMTFYSGNLFKEWRNSLFVATLRGEHLHRIIFAPDGSSVVKDEKLFHKTYGRLRDAIEGPEGALYVATSNRDGRGTPAENDDRILRITLK